MVTSLIKIQIDSIIFNFILLYVLCSLKTRYLFHYHIYYLTSNQTISFKNGQYTYIVCHSCLVVCFWLMNKWCILVQYRWNMRKGKWDISYIGIYHYVANWLKYILLWCNFNFRTDLKLVVYLLIKKLQIMWHIRNR